MNKSLDDDAIALIFVINAQGDTMSDLKELEDVIGEMRKVHETVDQYIMTDVNVEGERIAEIIEQANEAIQ